LKTYNIIILYDTDHFCCVFFFYYIKQTQSAQHAKMASFGRRNIATTSSSKFFGNE